jgi:hypothetical protein
MPLRPALVPAAQAILYGSQADSAGSIPVTRSVAEACVCGERQTGPPRISAWGPSETPRCGGRAVAERCALRRLAIRWRAA